MHVHDHDVKCNFIYKVRHFVVELAIEYPRESIENLGKTCRRCSCRHHTWWSFGRDVQKSLKVFDCKQTGIYLSFDPPPPIDKIFKKTFSGSPLLILSPLVEWVSTSVHWKILFPPPKVDFCQVYLKLALWLWRKIKTYEKWTGK